MTRFERGDTVRCIRQAHDKDFAVDMNRDHIVQHVGLGGGLTLINGPCCPKKGEPLSLAPERFVKVGFPPSLSPPPSVEIGVGDTVQWVLDGTTLRKNHKYVVARLSQDGQHLQLENERGEHDGLWYRINHFDLAAKAKPSFKAGDRVRCVNTTGTALRTDVIYTVDGVGGIGGVDVQLVGVKTVVQDVPLRAFSCDRFAHAVDQRPSCSEGDKYIGQPITSRHTVHAGDRRSICASEVGADPRRNWFRRRERASTPKFPATAFRTWPGVQDRSSAAMLLNELEVNKK